MLNKITLYIAISIVVSLGIGYGTGHYVASSKAEKDIAAIRMILEQQEAEKKSKEEIEKKISEQHRKDYEEVFKQIREAPKKSY